MRVKYSGKCLDLDVEATVETADDKVRAPSVLWVECLRRGHHEDQQTYSVMLHRQAEPGPAGEETT